MSHAPELKLQVVVSHTRHGCWVSNSYPLEEPESCLRLSPLCSPTRRGCNGGRHSNKINNSTALFSRSGTSPEGSGLLHQALRTCSPLPLGSHDLVTHCVSSGKDRRCPMAKGIMVFLSHKLWGCFGGHLASVRASSISSVALACSHWVLWLRDAG